MIELVCYRKVYATLPDVIGLASVRRISAEHIRACPHGAMKWATRITWHDTGLNLAAAANGEYLDHGINYPGDPEPLAEHIRKTATDATLAEASVADHFAEYERLRSRPA